MIKGSFHLPIIGLFLVVGMSSGGLFASESFHLITFLYGETHSVRQREYLECLEKNLCNEHIATMDIFFDLPDNAADGSCDMLERLHEVVECAGAGDRVAIIMYPGRPVFKDMIAFAQDKYPEAKIAVANADIFFDSSLSRVERRHLKGTLLAISRWEPADIFGWKAWNDAAKTVNWRPFNQLAGRGQSRLEGEGWALCSQDVWIFETPFLCSFPDDIVMGFPGCDNRIPYWAYQSGYKVFNPVLDVRCYHVHRSGIRHTHFTGKFPEDAAGVFASILLEPGSDEWNCNHITFIG